MSRGGLAALEVRREDVLHIVVDAAGQSHAPKFIAMEAGLVICVDEVFHRIVASSTVLAHWLRGDEQARVRKRAQDLAAACLAHGTNKVCLPKRVA